MATASEKAFAQTLTTSPAKTAVIDGREPLRLRKRIGSTVFTANAYFATNTSETLEDKILRLARNNGLDFQSENAEPMRTGRLPERSAIQ
jgi:hypothetical protein